MNRNLMQNLLQLRRSQRNARMVVPEGGMERGEGGREGGRGDEGQACRFREGSLGVLGACV